MIESRDDIATPEAAERIRRSIAMLTPGHDALNREEALWVLDALLAHLRHADSGHDDLKATEPRW